MKRKNRKEKTFSGILSVSVGGGIIPGTFIGKKDALRLTPQQEEKRRRESQQSPQRGQKSGSFSSGAYLLPSGQT